MTAAGCCTVMLQNKKIPVSVIIVTKNEALRIARCLSCLQHFSEIIVVDSASTDRTVEIAAVHGARVVDFAWNGAYPKKRQWCLDVLSLQHDWVFFVDADEDVTPELVREIAALELDQDRPEAGFFVHGHYVVNGGVLQWGLCNNKLALIDRRKMEFPVVDDLDLPGMGEIEGHYQPVLKPQHKAAPIGQIRAPLQHYAEIDGPAWVARHLRYAAWEAGMNVRQAWPKEISTFRQFLKTVFRRLPARAEIAFLHSYILKAGFLDGAPGFILARSRWRYYRMILNASKARASSAAPARSTPEKA